jgi:YD repeat-containing protein
MNKTSWYVLSLLLACATGNGYAQEATEGRYPWEEYDRLVKAKGAITAHGPTLFGDEVSLYNGALSFSATDVSIRGNGNLEVALSRTYAVANRGPEKIADQPFADWELDTPRISGVFAPNWPEKRCSVTSASAARPPVITGPGDSHFDPEDYWQGNQASLPGGGEMLVADQGAPRPSTGGPYYWLTSGFTYFSCLDSLKNGTGEGFLAITADGTKYWFDWMAQYQEPDLIGKAYDTQWAGGPDPRFPRAKNVIYATRVEDRFGNWVTYTYENSWNKPARLTRIDSSDQRALSVAYNANGHIQRVSDGRQAWLYEYSYANPIAPTLTAVVLPDQSRWRIDFAALTVAGVEYEKPQHSTDVVRSCFSPGILTGETREGATGKITHPSGAIGTFFVKPKRHGRSNVPQVCDNYQSPVNDPNDDVAYYPVAYDSLSLMSKQITGPGLEPITWQYSYTAQVSWAEGTGPVCTSGDCGVPKCLSDACAGTAVTTVVEPNGDWTRHTFGNSYYYNEGKLLRTERANATNTILSAETSGYLLATSGVPFKAPIGTSPQPRGDNIVSEQLRPQRSKVIDQDGTSFNWSVPGDCIQGHCFDEFARPTKVVKTSSLGFTATYATAYHNDAALWMLGQVRSVTQVESGLEVERTDFGYKALPVAKYVFSRPLHTLGYHSTPGFDGLLHTFKDAKGSATTLTNWYRGVPRAIAHADGTTESAEVNPDGAVASATDEAGATSTYRYDAMGRLSQVTHPVEADMVWNATTQTFAPSTSSAHGLPAGHWQQTITTGNARKITYFDALWRPVVEHEYDAADPTGTARFKRFTYDHAGRVVFASYPGSTSVLTSGVWTEYDALGRVTSVSQDSEHNLLTTRTVYEPGFIRRTTNPRGQSTVERFQAFDAPTFDYPVRIDAPEGTRTTIVRDVFGKPTSMTRGSSN